MEYFSPIKKDNEILPFATTWMSLEGMMLSKRSDKERQMPYDLIHMWNLKQQKTEQGK